MTNIVERLRACHGANSRDPGYCCQEAAEHIERLEADAKHMRNDIELRGQEIERLGREIERYAELLRGVGANRYWEGRWRDEAAAERERCAQICQTIAEDNNRIPNHPAVLAALRCRDAIRKGE